MAPGKTMAALIYLPNMRKGVCLDDTLSMENGKNRIVRDMLKSKHPSSQEASPDSIDP